MRGLGLVAAYALREAIRRRVFVVVVLLTAAFLVLYTLGVDRAFDETSGFAGQADEVGVDSTTLAGATVFGLSMFATLFLGVVLLGVVRSDAERGLLQPVVVRPLGRPTYLAGRYVAAAAAAAVYVVLVYFACLVITGATGGWWPDRTVAPAVELAAAVAVVTAISLLGSVFLTSTANGIAVFMLFGAGLTAGLLGQVGEAIGSDTLVDVSRITSWVLPFEALYQDALARITTDTGGFTKLAIDLGPFGGAQSAGAGLWIWAFAYTALIAGAAVLGFVRRDL